MRNEIISSDESSNSSGSEEERRDKVGKLNKIHPNKLSNSKNENSLITLSQNSKDWYHDRL